MRSMNLDEVDRDVLSLLQHDARRTTEETGEAVGASASTIRNRIEAVLDGKDVQFEAVGTDDIARISDSPSEIGLDVRNPSILESTSHQPFDHFGEDTVTDEFEPEER